MAQSYNLITKLIDIQGQLLHDTSKVHRRHQIQNDAQTESYREGADMHVVDFRWTCMVISPGELR